ncbi:MAG: cation transporter [Eubacteriales bacterium]
MPDYEKGIGINMKKVFKLEGLDCAHCAGLMDADVKKIEGIEEAYVNFLTTKMFLVGDAEAMPSIVEEATKIVHKYEPQVVVKKA